MRGYGGASKKGRIEGTNTQTTSAKHNINYELGNAGTISKAFHLRIYALRAVQITGRGKYIQMGNVRPFGNLNMYSNRSFDLRYTQREIDGRVSLRLTVAYDEVKSHVR